MEQYHGTTILGVKKDGRTVIAGDGQVSLGNTVIKPNAKKVRRLGDGSVIGGFAGATADAFTLFERLEKKLEAHRGQLLRAAVELAKDWRTDKYLRNLEAMMIVADKETLLILTGSGNALITYTGFSITLFLGIAVFALFVLRWREPNAPRPFKALGYPVAPAIFTLACFFILANALYTDLVTPLTTGQPLGPSAAGLFVIALGLPLYFWFAARSRRAMSPETAGR